MMYTKSQPDLTATLGNMIYHAKQVCNYDENAAIRQVAAWVAQDRRFDKIGGMTAIEVAREAFDARQAGRELRLSKAPVEPAYDSNRRLEGAAPIIGITRAG
jgi:hypothetical protein